MNQLSTPQPNLTASRITDLQAFADLGISVSSVEAYDLWQQIYERQDRQRSARIVLYATLVVLGIGILALFISILATLLSLTTWSFITSTSIAGLDGVFFFGYKQLVKHFYPILPEPTPTVKKKK